MIEVLFGVILGMAFAIFWPDAFAKLKKKIMNVIHNDHDCK